MSSSNYKKLLRFSLTHLRSVFPPSSSEQDETHYQHGIPGIPTDGRVVLLKNSNNGAQIYLVGTVHISEQSAETVQKVIDYVRPDVVAEPIRNVYMQVELCKGRAEGIVDWKPEDDSLYKLFRESMRAPGGLCMKIGIFFLSCWYRRLHANGTFPGLEFKVAIEESSRVGATYFCIDQDSDVTLQQVSKVFSFNSLRKVYTRILDELKKPRQMIQHHTDFIDVEYTRSLVKEMGSYQKKLWPEFSEVMLEDRDKFMFSNLRSFQGKVVAVVGMGHMDGIELLWKGAEEDDRKQHPLDLKLRVSHGDFTFILLDLFVV
ncbi:hypothetical protein C5167_037130 [Papaver somniferum]|uniref:TraB family protein n=1 Tax=Papaver somniferum TaxID=3469 RepID=A0A4Y7I8Z1_PAPSO|nr:hypothetical protein C5167_037130 [Papaver somniferum]